MKLPGRKKTRAPSVAERFEPNAEVVGGEFKGQRVHVMPGGPIRLLGAWLPCVCSDGKLRPLQPHHVRPIKETIAPSPHK